MKKLLLALGILFACLQPLHAQDAMVVQTCGTLPIAYSVGSTRFLTVDTNGNVCQGALAISGAVTVTGTVAATQSGTWTLGSSQNNIGNVGGKTVSICVTPTVTASNNYGTNFVVGGLLTFANAFTSTGTGIIQTVTATIKKIETSGFTFFTFNSNPSNTTWTDAAVAQIAATDVSATRPPISLSANSQLGTVTTLYGVGLGQAMATTSTSLYGVLIANAALTTQFTATQDVQVCVSVLQDL